ncbi:energy transducer TonB [Teichococcus oryzae]|uniref:Energy transducer TonB n=1 Tax=Teichococcus oryzae TaxID=1608942 RepID=A0A5B2TL23_9PROT|nr:TonB family protein [Pseudoroseomonas oryzae]KAA2215172.1 energy transducer TonB [Pseudoroseomonas oryzae]
MSGYSVTAPGMPRFRSIGWGASVLLHGGAAAFLVFGLPSHPPPPPVIIPLEVAALPAAPTNDVSDPSELVEAAEPVAAEPVTAEPVPAERVEAQPPPLETVPPPDMTQVAPPEAIMAEAPPEPTPIPPEPVPAAEPETAPILEAELPPPPPAAPPPPVQAAPPPPRPAPPRPVARPSPSSDAPRRADAAPAPAPSAPSAAAAPAPPGRMAAPPASYISRLNAALARAKRYPNSARIRRQEGTAVLNFHLDRGGRVLSWQVVRSTGHAELDRAVGEMIERASPLPPPPDDLPGSTVELAVPVNFSLR